MKNNLILYETYYGTSKRTAEAFALIVGNSKVVDVNEENINIQNYENIIFAFAFHGYETAQGVKKFIEKNKDEIQNKKVMLIGVGLMKKDLENYAKGITEALGREADYKEFVEGELRVNRLTSKDKKVLEEFMPKVNMKLMDMGKFKIEEVCDLASKYWYIFNTPEKSLEKNVLQGAIDEFINSHNTCALATGNNDFVRVTPIEYLYHEGSLYFITEGGIKFKGILLNKNISVCIYEEYTGMQKLKGLQLDGTSEIVKVGSDEYNAVIAKKGLKKEVIEKLPINLNMVKMKIEKYEFLNSDFKRMDSDARQFM